MRARGRPDALTAAAALELATLGGARVLGLDAEIGSLVPGKQADLTVISLENSPFDPSKILPRQPSLVALPSASQLLWSAANSATGKEPRMARFDKSSTKRPKPDAAVAASRRARARQRRRSRTPCSFRGCGAMRSGCSCSSQSRSVEDSCIFGVGAGGTGVGDIFRGNGGTSGVPSISKSREADREDPEERGGLA